MRLNIVQQVVRMCGEKSREKCSHKGSLNEGDIGQLIRPPTKQFLQGDEKSLFDIFKSLAKYRVRNLIRSPTSAGIEWEHFALL